jgi:hypothetical protein
MSRTKSRLRLRGIVPALLIAALLGACSDIYYDRREGVSLQAGNAVASNIAVETIDPWPAVAANRAIPANGQRMQAAVERYRNNKITPPQGTGTSSVKYEPILAAPAAAGASSGGGSNP